MFAALRALFRKPRRGVPEGASILYSTPSVNDSVGPITRDTTTVRDRMVIHSDDWRHTELVHAGLARAIQAELADISTIHQLHKGASGWSKVHIRQRVPEPIAGVGIVLADLAREFAGMTRLKGVGYFDSAGLVDDGFAFTTPGGLQLYGQVDPGGNEQLTLVCFEPCILGDREKLRQEVTSLVSFAAGHGLRLVCWNKLCGLEPNVDEWLHFFETQYHV